MPPPSQMDHEHEKIVDKLDAMNTGIRESLRAIHDDLRKILIEVNGKYDELKDEVNEERIARTRLEGKMALIEQSTNENSALWKKVIYTGLGAGTLAVLAGLAKAGGVW